MMVDAGSHGARGIILQERHVNSAFFDLRTGLAGEILQKFSNYRVKHVIIGDFKHYDSKSLDAFILENNRGNLAFFVPDLETVIAKINR
jgi:hypothetical protein